MKEIVYNFIMGLKELSKEYNFEGALDVELSPTEFAPKTYYTEFEINKESNEITVEDMFNIRDDMYSLLRRIGFTSEFVYIFNIITPDGRIQKLFNDCFKPSSYTAASAVVKFPYNTSEDLDQYYTLNFNNGKVTLEKDHENTEEYFKANPKMIDYLNSFIDNKIATIHQPTANEIIQDIRKVRENRQDYIRSNLITPLNFGFHYNNNGMNGVYSSFEYYTRDEDYYIKKLHELKFTSNLPSYGLFRQVDMLNYTEVPLEYTKTKAFTTCGYTNVEQIQYLKNVIESFIHGTDIEFDDIKSIYINLDMLDYSTSYIIDNTFRMIAEHKLLAQIEFWDTEPIVSPDFDQLKENIHKFLYETHAEGYSILATELEDDDSEFGGIPYVGFTLIRYIQEIGESFDIVNDMEKLNQDLKDSGIKTLELGV